MSTQIQCYDMLVEATRLEERWKKFFFEGDIYMWHISFLSRMNQRTVWWPDLKFMNLFSAVRRLPVSCEVEENTLARWYEALITFSSQPRCYPTLFFFQAILQLKELKDSEGGRIHVSPTFHAGGKYCIRCMLRRNHGFRSCTNELSSRQSLRLNVPLQKI